MISQVVYNYSKAFIQLAAERDQVDLVRTTAEALLPVLQMPEVIRFLAHPQISKEDKRAFFRQILPDGTSQEFRNFIDVVLDHHQERLLMPMIENVIDLAIQSQGFEIVTLISAVRLTEEQQESLKIELEERWGTRLFLKYRENPNLLGGVVIQRGDKLYDGSLAGQLNQLREVLITDEQPCKEGTSDAFTD